MRCSFTRLVMVSFLASSLACSARSVPSSSVLQDSRSSTLIQVEITSDADSGVHFPEPLPLQAVGKGIQDYAEHIKRVFADSEISAKVRELSDRTMSESRALMVRSVTPFSSSSLCGDMGDCEGLALRLETYVPGAEANSEGGMLVARRALRPGVTATVSYDPARRELAQPAFLLGAPVSLNVLSLSMQQQGFYLARALTTQVWKKALESLAAERGISLEQILVKSAVSATPGSQCRSTVHPCRDNYFRLVMRGGRTGQSEDLGSLFIRDFIEKSDDHLDLARVLPVGDRHESDWAFEMRFASLVDLAAIENYVARTPDFVRVSTRALLADPAFNTLRQEHLGAGRALMVASILSPKSNEENGERQVEFNLESYSPGEENRAAAIAVATFHDGRCIGIRLDKTAN